MLCNCGKEHSNKLYCSRKCQYQAYKKLKVERIKIDCLFCNKEFETTQNRKDKFNRKYCSRKCKDQHTKILYRGTGNPLWNKEITAETRKKHSESFKRLWKTEEFRKKITKGFDNFKKMHGYHPGTDKESQEKKKKTYLSKYGVDHNWKVKEISKMRRYMFKKIWQNFFTN